MNIDLNKQYLLQVSKKNTLPQRKERMLLQFFFYTFIKIPVQSWDGFLVFKKGMINVNI